MLYLLGDKEVYYIFDNNDDTLQGIADRAIKTYKDRPGFFKPYRNGYEFAGELIAPVIYPLAGMVTAGYSAFVAFVSAAVCVGTLFVAVGAGLLGASEFRDNALGFASLAFQYIGVALLTSAVGALLGIISLPHSLASIVTRSASTLVALGSDASFGTETVSSENLEAVDMDDDKCAFRCI